MDAEQEVQDRVKALVASEWAPMRQVLQKRYGQMEGKDTPAKEHVEKKLAEVEGGEYRAEPLTEVVSKDEVDPGMQKVKDGKGACKCGGVEKAVDDHEKCHGHCVIEAHQPYGIAGRL